MGRRILLNKSLKSNVKKLTDRRNRKIESFNEIEFRTIQREDSINEPVVHLHGSMIVDRQLI